MPEEKGVEREGERERKGEKGTGHERIILPIPLFWLCRRDVIFQILNKSKVVVAIDLTLVVVVQVHTQVGRETQEDGRRWRVLPEDPSLKLCWV